MQLKSADPRRVKASIGGCLPPPTRPPPGPLVAKVSPNSSIRTLYVYWGQNLVDVDQILRRGAPRPTLGHISLFLNLSELVPNFGQADLCP